MRRRLQGILFAFIACLCTPLQAGVPPYGRELPNALEMFEAGLYWLRDWTGPENAEDPASLLTLIEEQAARQFDFAAMASAIDGPRYWAGDVLQRSHYQRDLRDWLFVELARESGLLDHRPVRYRPLLPLRAGVFRYVAGTDVWRYGRTRARLLFHFAWTARGWRIHDVSLNGQRVTDFLRTCVRDWPTEAALGECPPVGP
ncbi:MAG TPA: hypothetical protein VIR60_08910 [Gammaproteobacteria bacterium]